jgi:hypothetical protein
MDRRSRRGARDVCAAPAHAGAQEQGLPRAQRSAEQEPWSERRGVARSTILKVPSSRTAKEVCAQMSREAPIEAPPPPEPRSRSTSPRRKQPRQSAASCAPFSARASPPARAPALAPRLPSKALERPRGTAAPGAEALAGAALSRRRDRGSPTTELSPSCLTASELSPAQDPWGSCFVARTATAQALARTGTDDASSPLPPALHERRFDRRHQQLRIG